MIGENEEDYGFERTIFLLLVQSVAGKNFLTTTLIESDWEDNVSNYSIQIQTIAPTLHRFSSLSIIPFLTSLARSPLLVLPLPPIMPILPTACLQPQSSSPLPLPLTPNAAPLMAPVAMC